MIRMVGSNSEQVVAAPLAHKRSPTIAPRRNRLLREPALHIAADYSVSILPFRDDDWDAMRYGCRSRRPPGTPITNVRLWVT